MIANQTNMDNITIYVQLKTFLRHS